ncbi:YkgJ family cysteine cluster protein [bacterium]|nr:MAG: YkgJ family cysteine cluster protein [bacterium]
MDEDTIDAGEFSEWLAGMRRVLRGEAEADVPCGDCVGCCVSRYYIRIRRQDRAALAGIAASYLVKPPGITPGDALMGWRHDGTCPALVERRCTVYAQRPLTCRDYDCRVFVASGGVAGNDEKAVINDRVRAWRFRYADERSRRRHDAVLRAADFIRRHGDRFPAGYAPDSPTGIAVLAIKIADVFESGPPLESGPQLDAAARASVDAARAFDAAVQ